MRQFVAFAVVIVSTFWGAGAGAQSTAKTVLRAGEHADFTRLVMAVPDDFDWRLHQSDGHVDLLFSDATFAVDLSETFDRIPRTRLRAVDRIDSGLRLHLACPCPARRVEGVPGQLVLDIYSADPGDTAERADLRPRARPTSASSSGSAVSKSAGRALARRMKGQADLAPTDPLTRHFQVPAAADMPSPPPRTETAMAAARKATQKLGSVVSDAVGGNLLSPNPDFEPGAVSAQGAVPTDVTRHIRSQRNRGNAPQDLPADVCQGAISARIADWSSPPPPEGPGQAWGSLYDPLDRIVPDAANTMATEFLRRGLGAEARSLLELLPEDKAGAVMRQLTYVIDLEPPPDPAMLSAYADCSDMDMLWAFLSDPAATLGQANARNRVVRAVQGLSGGLQRHLGGTIVNKLLQHDAADTARLVTAVLERSSNAAKPSPVPEMLLAQPDTLAEIQSSDLLDLPDADLLLILENANRRDLALSPDVLSLAIDRQFALRRSDLGRRFARVAARLLARAQEFDAAFRIANASETGLTRATRADLLSDLFDMLVQLAPDPAFVTVAFAQAPWEESGLTAQTRTTLGNRLAKLGFVEAAARLQGSRGGPVDQSKTAATSRLPPANIDSAAGPAPGRDNAVPAAGPVEPRPAGATASPGGEAAVASPPMADRSAGLLSQGRQALESSEGLRTRLESLLGDPPGENLIQ